MYHRYVQKVKFKYICIFLATITILDFFGVFTHIFEHSYQDNFQYPYNGDIRESVMALKNNQNPPVQPINQYNYTYLINNEEKCIEKGYKQLRIVFLIKSSIEHFNRRMAIRKTWGLEKRFFDVPIKTIFFVGQHPSDQNLQLNLNTESIRYKDIVQANFIDSYYNNTIKTMMIFKWLMDTCLNSKFYMFVDDDMYVSIRNILKFIRDPVHYPKERDLFDNIELPKNVKLYAGYVFISSPHRHKSSKWYVTLKEYPYDSWPPYVTAGSYVLSQQALIDLYYTSFYTRHFRFDDIYLGLVANKANIEPLHCDEFHFYKKDYTKYNYKYVISSHGYDDPNELIRVWNEQKALGNV